MHNSTAVIVACSKGHATQWVRETSAAAPLDCRRSQGTFTEVELTAGHCEASGQGDPSLPPVTVSSLGGKQVEAGWKTQCWAILSVEIVTGEVWFFMLSNTSLK